jgi:mRNA interferase MazF
VIVPFSSQYYPDRLFPVVRIPAGVGGLNKDSWAMCHQLRSISTSRIGRKMGTLNDPLFESIALVLADFLDL